MSRASSEGQTLDGVKEIALQAGTLEITYVDSLVISAGWCISSSLAADSLETV